MMLKTVGDWPGGRLGQEEGESRGACAIKQDPANDSQSSGLELHGIPDKAHVDDPMLEASKI